MDVHSLEKLRPLGKLETVSSACHHLGFYNNVGLSAQYRISRASTPPYQLHRLIYSALKEVILQHPVLAAIVIDEDTPAPYFARLPFVDLARCVSFVKRAQSVAFDGENDDELDAILQDQANTNFKEEYGSLPFWRLITLQARDVEYEFTASFIFHHAIGDGISGLMFHRSFLNGLRAALHSQDRDASTSGYFTSIKPNQEALLPPLEELHPLPLPPDATPPPTSSFQEWTGNVISQPCKTLFRSLCLSHIKTSFFLQDCKQRDISVTASLTSLLASILFGLLSPDTEALTSIIPVSLRPWLPPDTAAGKIGMWIDAFKVKLLARDYNKTASSTAETKMQNWHQAYKTSVQVKKYLQNVSPTGEPYTAVAVFKGVVDITPVFASALGSPRDAAFEVSNLGVFTEDCSAESAGDGEAPTWQVGKVTFSRSAVVSGSALTVNVVTGGDGRMTLGFTWQEGVVEAGVMERLIVGVGEYLEEG